MRCHTISYKIHGEDLQFVSVGLTQGQTVIAEAGSVMFMSDSVRMETRLTDGSDPNVGFWGSLWNAGKRALAGESLVLTHFSGTSAVAGQVAFAGPYPGKIVPLRLSAYGSPILCQRGAFLAAAFGTGIELAFTRSLGSGLLGGEGFVLQRLVGDGMAFVHACGKIVEISLRQQSLRVSPGCIVAFEESIGYGIEMVDSFSNMFGAKSIFWAKLTGTGHVWLQSLPFNVLANRICEEGKRQGLFGNPREAATPSFRLFE